MTRLLRLGTSLLPLIRLYLQQPPPLNTRAPLPGAPAGKLLPSTTGDAPWTGTPC
jgi:hypothetical protein